MWKYDKDGAEILVEEYVGNQLIQRTATIYWGRGKIETQISSSFDDTGMVGWNEEKYSYDMAGNCVRYSRTSYNQANTVTSWDVKEYEYDKNGVLKKMVLTNENGVYLRSSYDEEGRTILEEYFENGVAYGTTVYRYPDSYSERADWEYNDGRT